MHVLVGEISKNLTKLQKKINKLTKEKIIHAAMMCIAWQKKK